MKLDSSIAAIVTGGASGLGEATVRALAAEGVKVTIFDLNEELGTALAKEVGGHFEKVNVSDEATVNAGIAGAEAKHGVARIVVSCAGVAPGAKTVGKENVPHSIDVFRRAIEINLIGTFSVLSKAAARMATVDPIGEERGVIVNTASVAAYEGQVGQAAYAASKGGIVGLTLPVARDLAQLGIRCCTIAPGLFLTPMMKGLPQQVQDALGKTSPFPARLGNPDEYALLVKAIATNPMLNGEVIRLDAALRMQPK